MAEPTATSQYYFEKPGDIFVRPVTIRVRATFSSSGAVVTVSSTRRQSHPVTITGSSGTYSITGLPQGRDYHIVGQEMQPPAGTQAVTEATLSAFNSQAGTATLLTRSTADGSVAAPADTTVLFLTIDAETGVY